MLWGIALLATIVMLVARVAVSRKARSREQADV